MTVRRGEIATSLCSHSAYMKVRLSRIAIIDPPDRPRPPGFASRAETLMRYCVSVRPLRLAVKHDERGGQDAR